MTTEQSYVLVVDDEPNNLLILETYLQDSGYTVLSATDGKEAWEMIKVQGKFVSVILLDWQMPNMNGLEFLKLLHGHSEHYDIPVIMQTALAGTENIKECKKFGVYHYLRKPFTEEKVVELVRAALSGKRNLREMRKKNVLYNKETATWGIQKYY